jgi:hypothetical protein
MRLVYTGWPTQAQACTGWHRPPQGASANILGLTDRQTFFLQSTILVHQTAQGCLRPEESGQPTDLPNPCRLEKSHFWPRKPPLDGLLAHLGPFGLYMDSLDRLHAHFGANLVSRGSILHESRPKSSQNAPKREPKRYRLVNKRPHGAQSADTLKH